MLAACENRDVELFVKTPDYLAKTSNEHICTSSYFNKTLDLDYKYFIYKHLWSKGFYLTSGAKFGGDYLVYLGDPLRYHSSFILMCIRNKEEFESMKIRELVAYGRLATNVKKTFLIAYCCNNVKHNKLEILFTCINWSHI